MKRNQRLILSVVGLLLLLTWLSSTDEPAPLKKPEVQPLAVTRLLQRGYSPEAVAEAYYGSRSPTPVHYSDAPTLEPPTPARPRLPPQQTRPTQFRPIKPVRNSLLGLQ